MEGILTGLHARWPSLNVDVEFLDTKRRTDPANLLEMAEIIRKRYASTPHDVIVTTDDMALLFALDHTDLFGETPIVFCGFNGYPLEELTSRTNVTGIVETFDTRGILEFATEILPNLKGMLVVHDATELGEITRQEIERVAADFTRTLSFEYSYSKTIDEILSRVDALEDDWAILYSGLIRDASGVVLPSFHDMQRRMAARTQAPVFYISGGSVGLGDSENIHNTGIHHGLAAAERVIAIIDGTPPSSIPVSLDPVGKITADFAELKRLGVPLSKVPPHIAIIDAPEPRLVRYRNFALLGGGFTAVFAVLAALLIHDVTRRRKAEQELLRSRNRLRQVCDLSPTHIFAKNARGEFIFVNQKFADAHGTTPTQMVGRTTRELTPDQEQAERFHTEDLRVMHSKKPIVFSEESFTDANGKTRSYQTVKMPFVIEGTDEVAILGVSSDITEIKETRDEIRRLNEELETRVERRTAALRMANEELESFSYSVSHDLRSPLRTISGFAQVLLETHSKMLDDEGRDHLRRIVAAATHMGNLIDDLLKLARVSQTTLKLQRCEPTKVVTEIAEDLRRSDPNRMVAVNIKNVPPVMADNQLLRVALTNLIENAWKYSSQTKNPEIEFGCETEAGETTFYVKDNGAGFDMEHASKLFSPFNRLHSVNEFPGTGIGLATVHRVVSRHGGKIWAAAEVDKGATFRFTIGDSPEQD